MENTRKNKARFFAQYYGQMVLEYKPDGKVIDVVVRFAEFSESFQLILKPIESITDEHVQQVARLAHQVVGDFKIVRSEGGSFLVHAECETSVVTYHISINELCCINANYFFLETSHEKESREKANIGEITNTSKRPVPYIAITDYLRECGYAIPFNGLSVNQLVEYGWVKLSQ